MPFFSILLPTYKTQFLEECLNSILHQEFKDFEVVIVNDASPEDVDSIVSKFHDNRVRYYVNKENFGAEHVVKNWNRCLGYSKGEFVLCMGDDDMLFPKCLSSCYDAIIKHPQVQVFHLHTLLIDKDSKVLDIQEGRPAWESIYSATFNKLKGRLQYIGDWVFNASSLRKAGGFYDLPYAWGSDTITPIIVGAKTGIVNVSEFCFKYRVSNITISSDKTNVEGKIVACRQLFKWYYDYFSNPIDDNNDCIYRKRILELLPLSEEKSIVNEILQLMKYSRLKTLIFFTCKKKKLRIPMMLVFKALVLSYK